MKKLINAVDDVIAQVTTAVARGDLSEKIDVDARGEVLELKNTVNAMVDQLSAFASEVTRVAREVGTEGQLGGQATVPGVAGVWQELTSCNERVLSAAQRSLDEAEQAQLHDYLERVLYALRDKN